MDILGLPRLAQLSPHQLALAAPDGRHWSRSELSEAVMAYGSTARETGGVHELIAQLARDETSEIEQIKNIMEQAKLAPEGGNTHLCGHPLTTNGSATCAAACAQYGHALIMNADFSARIFLQALQRYRASSTCLRAVDANSLLQMPNTDLQAQDFSSLRVIWMTGQPWPTELRRAIAALLPTCQVIEAPCY